VIDEARQTAVVIVKWRMLNYICCWFAGCSFCWYFGKRWLASWPRTADSTIFTEQWPRLTFRRKVLKAPRISSKQKWDNNNNINNNNNTRMMCMVLSSWLCLRVIARVHPVHAMNVERRQTAGDLWTKPTDLSRRSACRQHVTTSNIAIYSVRKLMLILPSRRG